MNSVSPVYTEAEIDGERVISIDQPEYYPVIALRVTFQDQDEKPIGVSTCVRFRFSDKEREAISKGADLIIGQPHHSFLMPLSLQLAMPESYPISEKELV